MLNTTTSKKNAGVFGIVQKRQIEIEKNEKFYMFVKLRSNHLINFYIKLLKI